MNFLTMKQELADRLGAFDQTVSADDTRLSRWINMAQQELAGEWSWPFLYTLDLIQTEAEYTTGTADVNAGSASVTLSVAPAVSMADRFIKFSAEDEWYKITSHTAATTSVTISPSYGGTANLTGATFTIRKVYYSLSSTTAGIVDVKMVQSPRILHDLNAWTAANIVALLNDVGTPYAYSLEVPSAAGKPQIAFYPAADGAYNIFVRGKKECTDLVNTTDESIVPAMYHTVLIDLASYYGFTKLNNPLSSNAYTSYQNGVEKMKLVYRQDMGRLRVVKAVDAQENDPSFDYMLPNNVTE